MSIEYRVEIWRPEAHLFRVTMRFARTGPDGARLSLPDWIPGSYMIRDFSRQVITLAAKAGAEPVAACKTGKSSWQLPPGLSDVSVQYQVYALEWSVRAAHLDRHRGFFNGTSLFLALQGAESSPITVQLEPPPAGVLGHWRVATSLPAGEVDSDGFGTYAVADYDELIDQPVALGDFARIEFQACGVAHELVICGQVLTDLERVAADLARVCEHHIEFFGRPAPVDRYVFLVTIVPGGYGGLEHRASTVLMIDPAVFPMPGDATISDRYLEFLGLCSHEYFHTWNVKRIKPAVFMPFRLNTELHTRLLWFFEGITSYYDDLALLNGGLIDRQRYLGLLAKTLTRVQRGAGRQVQTVAESSFDAWHKFYKQDENAPNAIVSYYAKGALVALCLDALMRTRSNGRLCLDDLMRALWRRWLETGEGLAEREPEAVVAELLGQDVSDFFTLALDSVQELPLEASLECFGVVLQWRVRTGKKDLGGAGPGLKSGDGEPDAPERDRQNTPTPWLGARLEDAPGALMVRQVFTGGPAERAGLSPGDRLLAVECVTFANQTALEEQLKRHAGRVAVELHYIRQSRLYTASLPLESVPEDTAWLVDERPVDKCWK